jgi:hypothetical protein
MNKTFLSATTIVMAVTVMVACNGNKAASESTTASEPTTASEIKPAATTPPAAPANTAATYQLSFAPDTLYLGKEKEAFVKILSGEAIQLQDAEGKSTGTSIKFRLRVTNKSTLDDKKFFNISYSDARLELDNGTNAPARTGDGLNPVAESSLDGEWEFEIPAGTKPTKLNLFYDGTRVAVALSIK